MGKIPTCETCGQIIQTPDRAQYKRLRGKLMEAYPNYNIEFLLDLIQRENGKLVGMPQNLERALYAVRKLKEGQ